MPGCRPATWDRITIYDVTTNEILLDTTIQTAFGEAQAARTFAAAAGRFASTGQIPHLVTADQDPPTVSG